jgi:hypothetical protein
MIISVTTLTNGANFALDTNAFSLAAYNRLADLASEHPMEQVTLTTYGLSMGGLTIQHYPASWTDQPTPVNFSRAMRDVNKLLG